MKKLILLLLFCQLSLYTVHAQGWTDELDSVLTILEQEEIFHGQILIAEKGQILFSKAYGLNEKDIPIITATPLDLQSVTKSFTALSILILKSKGLLKLDDPLTAYFPKLPYKEVTIRHLMTMTSGLPRFLSTAVQYGDTTKKLSNDGVIELITKHKLKVKIPGSEYGYNTDNYVLLASIIEKASGSSYSEFVHENIFEPLKMDYSYVQDLGKISTEAINSANFYAVYGDGNIHSTAEDLYLFEQSLYTDQLIPLDILKESFEETKLNDGSMSNYGFSWWVNKNRNKTEISIIGDGRNIRASIQRYIETNTTFIYVHNFSGAYWKQVYGLVRNIWEGNEYTMPFQRGIYAIDTNLYKHYVGKYLTKKFGLFHVTAEDGKLFLRPDPIPGKEELVPSSETTFYFANQSIEWEFFKDDQGNVIGLGIKGNPETLGPKQD